LGNLNGGFHRSMIDRLKNHFIHLHCLVRLKRNLHLLVSISQALNTDTDRSVAHIAVLSFWEWVVVAVNHLV
jgi:hypothetical protein